MGIYKRERIFSKKIEIETEELHCDDVGLYVLTKNTTLEYSNDDFFEIFDDNKVWAGLARDTVVMTIANSIINKTIEIYRYNDRQSFLWNLFGSEISSYRFELNGKESDSDLLTNKLFDSIKSVKRHRNNNSNFELVIDNLLDKFVSYGSNNRGEKVFLINTIKMYSEKYYWLSINNKSGILNFILRKKEVDVANMYIPRIAMQIRALENRHNQLKKENWDYCRFFMHLSDYIEYYFKRKRQEDN